MSPDDEFSIITVKTDDDDAVIQADTAQPSWEDERAAHPTQPQEREAYYETTTEDLDTTGPMNKMRLGILSGGLLIIIGAVAYFLFLR